MNEPLILRTKSRLLEDGSYYYSAITMCGEGWIPADCQEYLEFADEMVTKYK